jgi:hypothetical protein
MQQNSYIFFLGEGVVVITQLLEASHLAQVEEWRSATKLFAFPFREHLFGMNFHLFEERCVTKD